MSNPLSVRRVRIETIDEHGNGLGDFSYGILAFDNDYQAFTEGYKSFADLEKEIQEDKSILLVLGGCNENFDIDPESIGTDNFLGEVERYSDRPEHEEQTDGDEETDGDEATD